jgi:hypothetical protein
MLEVPDLRSNFSALALQWAVCGISNFSWVLSGRGYSRNNKITRSHGENLKIPWRLPPRPQGRSDLVTKYKHTSGISRPHVSHLLLHVMLTRMAELVYIDETGSVGKGAREQPKLILASVVVDEAQVKPLADRMQELQRDHLGHISHKFEFHGSEIWSWYGPWRGKAPAARLAVLESVVGLLDELSLSVIHTRIDKASLSATYHGAYDKNSYLLALQFLLEKLDGWRTDAALRIIVADEAKEHELRAIKLVSEMQTWGVGLVPSRKLRSIIDSIHFVDSKVSYGVQLADVIAFILHRATLHTQNHPNADEAVRRMRQTIAEHTPTWRESWPR